MWKDEIGDKELDEVYSNFDHKLNTEIRDILFNEPGTFARHMAWNFNAKIYYKDKWISVVSRNRIVDEVLEGKNIEDVIEEANYLYGRK